MLKTREELNWECENTLLIWQVLQIHILSFVLHNFDANILFNFIN